MGLMDLKTTELIPSNFKLVVFLKALVFFDSFLNPNR